MSIPERTPRAVMRNRIVNRMKRSKGAPIEWWRSAPAAVIWRAKPCNCRVLSVLLDAEGWHVAGENFRVSLDEWARRKGRTREGYVAGEWAAFGVPRRVNGLLLTQPLEFAAWDMGRFEAGCDHGNDWFGMAEVHEDCAKFRACREQVKRPVHW